MRKNLSAAPKNKEDLHFMHSKNAAILTKQSTHARAVVWGGFFFVIATIYWMYISDIGKLTRGTGKVVPSLGTQYIQSYDGGIVSQIFVKNGNSIKIGDPIVRIDDTDFKSKYMENRADIIALKAKSMRLYAEANDISFDTNISSASDLRKKLYSEKKLYDDRRNTLEKKIDILKEKLNGKIAELESVNIELDNLQKQLQLTKESVDISTRMLSQKVVSKLQHNEQLKQLNGVLGNIANKRSKIVKIKSGIKILKKEIRHEKLSFISKSGEELEEVNERLEKLQESKNIDEGRIKRALVVSPVSGVVRKMHYNSLGGVIKPGDIIAEIVPTKEHLIVNTKVDPSKIAFIFVGQKANIRFTAYNFAIYGMLKGKVTSISADTTMDKYSKKRYYTVKVKTYKNYLGTKKKQLPIKIGMSTIVDFTNGKQTILQYLLNPIVRAKQNMLSNN